MARRDLNVRSGSELTISVEDPGPYADSVVRIRPKTVAALKSIEGIPGFQNYFNADNSEHFEVIHDVTSLVKLETQGAKNIGGLSPNALKSVIYNLNHKNEIPKTLELPQRLRAPMALRGTTRARIPRWPPALAIPSEMPVVRYRELRLPEWVQKLQAYIEIMLLGNITLEAGACLILDRSVTHMQTYNFTMYRDSRIIQRATQLVLSVRGEMKGLP